MRDNRPLFDWKKRASLTKVSMPTYAPDVAALLDSLPPDESAQWKEHLQRECEQRVLADFKRGRNKPPTDRFVHSAARYAFHIGDTEIHAVVRLQWTYTYAPDKSQRVGYRMDVLNPKAAEAFYLLFVEQVMMRGGRQGLN